MAVLESYWAIGAFLIQFVVSRLTARSAVQFLDDESKIKLVNAAGKFNWMYLLMLAAFALFFVDLWLGFAACIAYFLFGVVFNFLWAKKSAAELERWADSTRRTSGWRRGLRLPSATKENLR